MLQKIIIILLLSLNHICFSQAISEQSFYDIEKPKDSGEEIILETDRQFYCVDERIYFTASCKFNYPNDHVHWSNIIYVELIRWNGERIEQAKFKLNDNSVSGYLTIPKTIPSGNYYFRAYTKWMRNFQVEDYSYRLVKVINPIESKIDLGPNKISDNKLIRSQPATINSYRGIECFTDKFTYQQRENVNLTIRLDNFDNGHSNFCVSVAKATYIDTNSYYIQFPEKNSPEEKLLVYLPEFRGVSISGKILNANDSSPLANAALHLSTPQNWQHFTTFHTTDNGFFNFTLPDFYGQYDFYIDALLENGEKAEILVDNDYCTRSINLTYIPFSLDSIEMKIALEMAVNMQIFNLYIENSRIHTPEPKRLPFYGSQRYVYYTKEYIQLPNLEEFFYELVREVRTIRIRKKAYLKIVGNSQYNDLNPLLLIDNIPVFDVEDFLKIPVDRIEKIEIIDKPYIVSGSRYSGVICVYTKRKDFAGIKLNNSSLFFNYNLLSNDQFHMSDYSSTNTSKVTYRRNLLFWDPEIELNQHQPTNLSFYTSDSKGEYIVYIRSISAKGKPRLYGTCKIVVE
ncbi:MAG: hypothetical protein WD577_10260 [Bacteroidales bacterium]